MPESQRSAPAPWISLLAFALLLPPGAVGQEVGPASGALIIAGGALQDTTVFQRFVELAGGPEAPIVVIPTAGGGDDYGPYYRGLAPFREAGARNLTVLHTYDPEVADTEEFVQPLTDARGVWFTGGRQWRLADAYLDTRVMDELWGVLERGGVIGGSSAGATIQGDYLVRGDTETNTIMMGDHVEGMAFLKESAIDQHLLARNRHFDLIEVVEAHPELLGIGLDENTAIEVRGDEFRVLGESYVAIYDHHSRLDSGGRFYFLEPGDVFDLATRTAYEPTRGREAKERVEEEPWPPR